jgi:NADH-quinone oxidoreductase subunit L
MTPKMLLLPILLPAVLAAILLLLPRTLRLLRDVLAVAGATVLVYYGFVFFSVGLATPSLARLGIDFDLRLYHFSSFILLALAGFLILITVYTTVKMKDAPRGREFMAYIFLTAAFANGAALANNFVPLVFFWEGLLITLYGMITIGGRLRATAVRRSSSADSATPDLGIGLSGPWPGPRRCPRSPSSRRASPPRPSS